MNNPMLYGDLAAARRAELDRRARRNATIRAQAVGAPALRQRTGRLLIRVGHRLAEDG
ncbi:MAG: hypothetical protein ACM30G_07375 [Micromonosporaceae bacterium]